MQFIKFDIITIFEVFTIEQKLENIYKKLKKNNSCKSIRIIEKEKCIIATFNKLEDAISILIDASKYSNNVNLIYNAFSKEYSIILHLDNI